MITVEPLFAPQNGLSSDPVLLGVTRGLVQHLEPTLERDVPSALLELAQRLDGRAASPSESRGA